MAVSGIFTYVKESDKNISLYSQLCSMLDRSALNQLRPTFTWIANQLTCFYIGGTLVLKAHSQVWDNFWQLKAL